MAKKNEIVVDHKSTIAEICEILKVEDTQIIETIKSLIQAAQRPVVAAMILIDPILKEPKISFIRNYGDTSFQEAEIVVNSAMDLIKSLKAQEAVKKQMEEEKKES